MDGESETLKKKEASAARCSPFLSLSPLLYRTHRQAHGVDDALVFLLVHEARQRRERADGQQLDIAGVAVGKLHRLGGAGGGGFGVGRHEVDQGAATVRRGEGGLGGDGAVMRMEE
jgi:hypothetical protein